MTPRTVVQTFLLGGASRFRANAIRPRRVAGRDRGGDVAGDVSGGAVGGVGMGTQPGQRSGRFYVELGDQHAGGLVDCAHRKSPGVLTENPHLMAGSVY